MRKGIDCHIHTFYQRCGNETLTVPAVIKRSEAVGLKKIAVTDHLNNFDRLERFEYIKSDIEAVSERLSGNGEPGVKVFFGAELNFLSCDGEFACNEKIREDMGFEVLTGGIHSAYTESGDTREVMDIQHRHFMKTLTNPLLDVLVHPFWFPRREVEQRSPGFWEKLISSVPDGHISELAAASSENGCAIEANAHAIFYNPSYSRGFKKAYAEFLLRLKEKNALFATGSDAHDIGSIGHSDYVEGLLAGLGVPEDRLWEPVRKEE